jgi:hypothetical protein
LITYIGVGFLLFGMFIFLVSATNPDGLGLFLALGVITFGMGLVLSYIGHKVNDNENVEVLYEGGVSPLPLGRIDSELERSRSDQDTSSGNRAFGFVLLSLGAFVLAVSGLTGFYVGSWPLLLLGAAFTISGIILRLC